MSDNVLLHEKVINEFFTYVEFDDPGGFGEIVPDGLGFLEKAEVADAIAITTRILADPAGSTAVFGKIGELFHPSIDEAKTMAVFREVISNKFFLTVQHDSDMGRSYMQCVPVPSVSFKWLERPIIIFNLKYILPAKQREGLQVYFLVCKILHEIGLALTPGLVKLIPGFDPSVGTLATPEKIGTVMLRGNQRSADCGYALEEIAYGGRVRTSDNSAKPFAKSLELIVRKYYDLPPGPGNFAVYHITDEYVADKVNELRDFAHDSGAAFPGIKIPAGDYSEQLEASLAKTREAAEKRIVRKKAKRSSLDVGGSQSEEEEEEDEDFQHLVDIGVAFSAEQVRRIQKGFRI